MRIDLLKKRLPDMPEEVLDQLARVNDEPAIHRYVQLHNSFELVLRYLAITSYSWVDKTNGDPALIAKLARKLRLPSLDTWNDIFVSCSKWLHEHGHVAADPKATLGSQAASRVLLRVAEIVPAANLPKKATSSGLVRSIIEYRNLTRGHGCVIYDGYEAFLDDLDSALFDFVLAWEELLNVRSVVRESGVILKIDGEEVASDLFLRPDENGRITFYNRKMPSAGSSNYYFLNYDTGLHQLVAEQGQRIREEIRLHEQGQQLVLFPKNRSRVEAEYGRREIHGIKKYLSYDYGHAEELHPAQEAEIRLLLGLRRLADAVRHDDALVFLLSSMPKGLSPEDAFYDFVEQSWRSLEDQRREAVSDYMKSVDLDELGWTLLGRVQEEFPDEEVREELRDLLARINAALTIDED